MKFKIIAVLGLLTTVGLSIPMFALAQGVQHNETDLEFIKRITTRLQSVERDAERLGDHIKDVSRREMSNMSPGQDEFGRQQHSPTGDRQSEYRRASSKMRSIRKKAGKERDKLADMQREGSNIDAEDRERIESTVSRMERDIANMESDIRQGRL